MPRREDVRKSDVYFDQEVWRVLEEVRNRRTLASSMRMTMARALQMGKPYLEWAAAQDTGCSEARIRRSFEWVLSDFNAFERLAAKTQILSRQRLLDALPRLLACEVEAEARAALRSPKE